MPRPVIELTAAELHQIRTFDFKDDMPCLFSASTVSRILALMIGGNVTKDQVVNFLVKQSKSMMNDSLTLFSKSFLMVVFFSIK